MPSLGRSNAASSGPHTPTRCWGVHSHPAWCCEQILCGHLVRDRRLFCVRIGQGAEIAFLGPWVGKVKCAAPTFHFFRKSSWYATEGLQHHKTPIRCPWSRQSRTNSSPGPCTPCGTNPCNLVYIWGKPNLQRHNAASTRDRGDGSRAAIAPRVRMPCTPNATGPDPGSSEC